MDPFELYTYEEAISQETGITRDHPKGYPTLINNLCRVGNLIYNYRGKGGTT